MLSAALVVSPQRTDGTANLARFYDNWGKLTTDPGKRKERLEAADSYFEQAVKQNPNWPALYVDWAGNDQAQGQNARAVPKLDHALALDETYADPWVHLGDITQGAQHWAEAEADYRKANGLVESAAAYIGLGSAYYREGKLLDALSATDHAAEQAPKDPVVHANLAVYYRDLKLTDRAIAEAQLALRFASPAGKAKMAGFLESLRK